MTSDSATIDDVRVYAYKVPTDSPESDGTLQWDSTTMVAVEIDAGGKTGLGYSYGHRAVATIIDDKLAGVIRGRDAMTNGDLWLGMVAAIRNYGRPGICSMGIAAVDIALWDLKARLLDVPLADLLGKARESVPVYGSGGFTSYRIDRLQEQLAGWAEDGMRWVKMKVGRDAGADPERVRAAREAIGHDCQLMVDANGAYSRKQAIAMGEKFADHGVVWYEEPVSSDDLDGLHLVRDRVPAGMEVSAGEYGFHTAYFEQMLSAGAVDVLQADITRCSGVTGWVEAANLSAAHEIPFSCHTAPALHLHAACALGQVRHMEWFHDHVRIERLLLDGTPEPVNGELHIDTMRPGHGLTLKHQDAQPYGV